MRSWFKNTLSISLLSIAYAQLWANSPDKTLRDLQQQLDTMLHHYELVELDGQLLQNDAVNYGQIDIDLMGNWLILEIAPRNLFAPDYQQSRLTADGLEQIPIGPVNTYQGKVLGDPDSVVAVQIVDGQISGLIRLGDETFFIRSANEFNPHQPANIHVMYRNSDIFPSAQGVCGFEKADQMLEAFGGPDGLREKATALSQGYLFQIASQADYEFVNYHGAKNVLNKLTDFSNQLDAIWQKDLNIRISITYQTYISNPNSDYDGVYGHGPEMDGPFADFLDDVPCDLVNGQPVSGVWEQFRQMWNTTFSGVTRDLAILFSRKDLRLCPSASYPNGLELFGTAGQFATICQFPQQSYVVMEEYPLNTAGLMAHEIGHSLNGEHRHGRNCSTNNATFMCGTVQSGSGEYSDTAKGVIAAHVGAHNNCLTPIYPEIRVRSGGINYADGSTFTFPNTVEGTPIDRNFRIVNDGLAELRIDNPGSLISGNGFVQVTSPQASLLQGESSVFRVRMTAASAGSPSGAITIQNNDTNEDPYNITLQGTVNPTCETVPPTASMTSPSNGQWLNTGQVTLTATASDNVHVVAVAFEVDGQVPGGNADLTPPYSYNWTATAGTHTIRARALDSCNNIGYSPYITVTVSDVPSTVPSFVARISGVVVNNQTFYDNTPTLNFTWNHALDDSGIERYQIVVQPQGGPWQYSPHVLYPSTSYNLNANLSYGTTYSYHIRAKNNLGNWGSFINAGQFTIQQPTPTTVPNFVGKIGGFNINNLMVFTTSPKVDFTWSHASDPIGIERYQIIIQPTTGGWLYQPHILYPATSRSIQTSGLIPGKSYSIHIRAKNSAGFWGPFVNGGTFHVSSSATKAVN